MKKLTSIILCAFIFICMLSTNVAFAQEAPSGEQIADVAATDALTDTDGYILTDDGEPVLTVNHVESPGTTAALDNEIAGGYYTAEFMIPESNYQVYLTGLTQDNVSEIRQAIIDSYTGDKDFDLKNLGFIDAEKTQLLDGDDSLCWAASASNILTYTGWASPAGFESTDDLFEALIDSFTDDGGNIEKAVAWFINGIATTGGAQPTAHTGKYLPKYNYCDLVDYFDLKQNSMEQLATVYNRIKDGYGASFGLHIYGPEGYEGAHAVSCWGFVTDVSYPETSKQFYKSVLITDSDSDRYNVTAGKDRREADDVMSLYMLEPQEQEGIDTFLFHISDHQTALIYDAFTIVPYSADVPYETSSDATLDPINYPDITLDPFVLTNDPDDNSTITTFAPDMPIYYQPCMMNVANADYYGQIILRVWVNNSQGDEVYEKVFSYRNNLTISPFYGMQYNKALIDKELPVGDYTITAAFNMGHNPVEAYFFNNKRSISFKIREQYLIGDVNNDDSIDITDATKIQRILAYVDTADDDLIQRSDIDESDDLDLVDATLIQRYLNHMEILHPIDIFRFYE